MLRNALIPTVVLFGLNIGTLFSGAVITESVFAIPGIGQMLVNAVYQHDHFAIQGVVLVVATGFVLINLAVDVAYALLDPRVRHGVDN